MLVDELVDIFFLLIMLFCVNDSVDDEAEDEEAGEEADEEELPAEELFCLPVETVDGVVVVFVLKIGGLTIWDGEKELDT